MEPPAAVGRRKTEPSPKAKDRRAPPVIGLNHRHGREWQRTDSLRELACSEVVASTQCILLARFARIQIVPPAMSARISAENSIRWRSSAFCRGGSMCRKKRTCTIT